MAMSRMYKPVGKGRFTGSKRTYAPRPNPKTMVVRGFTRVGGFYGRFRRGRRATDAELKFYDQVYNAGVLSQTGERVLTSLNSIAQGDGESERIGRKITMKQIHIKGRIQLPATLTTTATSDIVRIMVVLDKQTNGAAFNTSDLLVGTTFSGTYTYAYNNLENKSRFRVLSDKVITVTSEAATSTTYGASYVPYEIHLKCNLPIEFDSSATTGALSTVRSNNLCLWACSENQTAEFVGTARVRYSDN